MTPQPQTPALLESGIYDIVEPALFPWVPPTLVWYLLGAFLLSVGLLVVGRRLIRRRNERRIVPQAIEELSLLSNETRNLPEAIFRVLIKVVSITGIKDIAALTAEELEALPLQSQDRLPVQTTTTSIASRATEVPAAKLPESFRPTLSLLATLQRHRYQEKLLNDQQMAALLPQAFEALRAIPSKGIVRL